MTLTVLDPGALTTIQDRGRRGVAHLGVARAGVLDAPAAALGNRILGNDPDAAVLETTLTGLSFRVDDGLWFAVTGAPCPVTVDGQAAAHAEAVRAEAGAVVRLGAAVRGVRSYVAVAGGIAVEPVLGSRSTDTLAWVGPPRVAEAAVLPVGPAWNRPHAHDTPRERPPGPLRVLPGPRADWFGDDALSRLCSTEYRVGADSNRIGLRLRGRSLVRTRSGELPSEGMVLGGVQVPPDGQPVVLLADHPVTGGYPVVAVVHPDDLALCAQTRPGDVVSFTPDRG